MSKIIYRLLIMMITIALMSSCSAAEIVLPYAPSEEIEESDDVANIFDEDELVPTYHEGEANDVDAEYSDEKESLLTVVRHSISDNMDEFIFEFHYQMRVLYEHNPNVKLPIVNMVNISTQSGELIQALDLSHINAEMPEDFIDINFDGFLDLRLRRSIPQPHPLRWAHCCWYYSFIWNNDTEQFELNEQLMFLDEHGFWQAIIDFIGYPEILEMGNSIMLLDDESQMLIFSSALSGSWFYFSPMERYLPSQYIMQYYQYTNGQFTLLRIQEMLYNWDGVWRVRDLDTETGIEIITYIA